MVRVTKEILKFNRKGAGPSMTWVIIGFAAAVAIIMLCYSAYSGIMSSNGQYIDPMYKGLYQNLSNANGSLNLIGQNMTSTDALTGIKQVGTGIVGGIVMGLASIQSFLAMPAMLLLFFNTVASGTAGIIPAAMLWFFTFVIGVYIAMKTLQAMRGTIIEA